MVKRRGIAALALGMALVIAGVGCAEDDDFLIGGKRPTSKPTTNPDGSGGDGGGNGDGSGLGGGIGTGDKPVATPTPAPTPTPTPSPTSPPPGTLVHSYDLQFDNPEGIAFDPAGNAWIACYGDGLTTSVLTKVAGSGQLLMEPPVGIGPRQLAVDAGGNAWVVNSGSNSVTRVAADGGASTPIEVGEGPRALAFKPDGTELWVALGPAGGVVALDVTTLATRSVVPVAASGLAFLGDKVWIGHEAASSIGVYSLDGIMEREIGLGSKPGLVRARSGAVWVLTANGASCIEPDSGTARAISVSASQDLALDASGGAWITQGGEPKLVKRYAANGDFMGNYSAGLAPHGLALHPGTGYLWITDRVGKRVHVLAP